MSDPGIQIPTSPSVDLMLSSCTTSRWAAWDTMGSKRGNDVVTHAWQCLTLRTERKKKSEKSLIIWHILTKRGTENAADGIQLCDDFVACSPCRFVNTICAATEGSPGLHLLYVIMWLGSSHKHNSLWSCCLLWTDQSNHDSPSICCWWLISEGVPGVANGNSLSLAVTLTYEMWPVLVFIAESQLYPDWHCSMG